MPVYQPNAVIGNPHVLVTLGARGELMSFFYPHIDFSQNLHEGMPAVYLPATGRLVWTFDPSWEGRQRYLGRTNIVETELRHRDSRLSLKITDFVHPSESAFFRRFEVCNHDSRPLRATLYQYLDLQLGEVARKNAVHYHTDFRTAVAYWRNICFAIAAETLTEYGCGRTGSPTSAKHQMAVGRLNQQREEIGDIDLAVGWHLSLAPGERVSHDLVIAAEANEPAAVERVVNYRYLGRPALLRWAEGRWEEYVLQARPVAIDDDLREGYYRCLLALGLLADPDTGSILAAPEFDPAFERSGGYGYCWPRDAVEACMALEAAGFRGRLGPFLAWAKRTQRPEGYWEQRYWLTGQRGPAWCTEQDRIQIDQTASVLFAMGRYARTLAAHQRPSYVNDFYDPAMRAASYLVEHLDPATGLHTPGFDLWESFQGSFTYSNAAIAAALQESAFIARLAGQEQVAKRHEQSAVSIKQAVMSRLWLGEAFARGLDSGGKQDPAADASVLGVVEPFALLNANDSEEREIARLCLESVAARLNVELAGAKAVRRFEGDHYAGGGPGALATVWLARVLLRLAMAFGDQEKVAQEYRARAIACLRTVLGGGTSTGLLPEMMGAAPGGHWAVPHAWTSGSFVLACLLLDELQPAA